MKRFLYFFTWTMMIGFILYLGLNFKFQLEETAKTEYKMFPIVMFSAVFPIGIGLLLRLPQLLLDIKENRKWIFDWVKFIAIGLPTLYILLIPFLSYAGIVQITKLYLIGDSTLPTIAGIVFGYVLLDSLKK